MSAIPPRIGIIGFGEVGSSFARGLLGAGVADIIAYDDPPGPVERALAERRAGELGVPLAFEPSPLADREILLSSVTQDAALAAARRTAPWIGANAVYADVNSLSPAVKAQVAAIVEGAGRAFVDIAIMGAPIDGLHRVPLLAAGLPAPALAALLAPFGTDIRVVGERPGQAAGVKILRSVLTKGLEALLVESLVAARRYDLDDQVLDSFLEIFERKPARAFVDFLIRSHTVHAGRRALEIEQSAQAIADVGLDPVLARAVSARLEALAGLGLKQRLGGVPPADIGRAVALLDDALGTFPVSPPEVTHARFAQTFPA